MDEVEDLITQILPSIEENKAIEVYQKLGEAGVRSVQDLEFVQEEDVGDCLTKIECRKLLQAFKQTGKCDARIFLLIVQQLPVLFLYALYNHV